MNGQSTIAIDINEADVAADLDDGLFKKILAVDHEPPPRMATTRLPGGGTAFDPRDYATEEEADVAMEDFPMDAQGGIGPWACEPNRLVGMRAIGTPPRKTSRLGGHA